MSGERPAALWVGAASALFVTAIFLISFTAGGLHPEDLLVPGQAGPSVQVISEDFGPPTNPRPGYDGQQVYALARAFPDLQAARSQLDDPAYRSSRILQSALASPAPRGVPLVLTLLALGIVGVGLAAGAVADLAERHGRDARIGFLVIPCLAAPLLITTNEALAFGLALVAIVLLDRGRLWPAMVVGALAALTKEAALVVLGAAVLGSWPRERWRALPVVLVPLALYAAWYAFVVAILPSGAPAHFEVLGLRHLRLSAIAFVLVVIALGLVGAWLWRDVAVAWPVSLAFGLWPLVFQPDVLDWLALVRVAAPALVFGITGIAGALMSRRATTQPAAP